MKKILISVLIIFFAFFFLFPKTVRPAEVLPPPPGGSDCIPFPFSVGSCSGSYSYYCSDNSTYWWCCTNSSACEDVAPATPVPPQPWGEGGDTIETAIGPINVKNPESFVSSILNLAIGIGGGIAMLLIIFGGIQILTSGGNPDSVKAGKEMITSAIAGLILIIFAVFILRLIGVEILGIFE